MDKQPQTVQSSYWSSRWSYTRKATVLIFNLRGDYLEILHTISESQQQSYYTLTERLEMRYPKKHLLCTRLSPILAISNTIPTKYIEKK